MRGWKKKVFAYVLAAVMGLSLAACGQSGKEYDDKSAYEELLQETEKKNEGLKAPESIPDEYFYQPEQGKEVFGGADLDLWRASKEQKEMAPWVSREDAEQELSWLLRLLRTYYGNYGRGGGDEAFEAAVKNVLEGFAGNDRMEWGAYGELLSEEFAFATEKDRHFSIGFTLAEESCLLGSQEVSFWKSGGKYYMDKECTKEIKKVGGKAPETYLRPSIGPEGEFTWYPYIVGKPGEQSRELEIEYAEETLFSQKTKKKTLSLTETDYLEGEGEADQEEKNKEKGNKESGIYQYEERDGIPWIKWNKFPLPEKDSAQEFIASASKIKTYPYAVIDLSDNGGGEERTLRGWFEEYTGRLHAPHFNMLERVKTEELLTEEEDREAREADREMYRQMGQTEENGYNVIRQKKREPLENSQQLFLVTSRRSASCAEMMTDSCRGIEHTVVIGADTWGCLSGDVTEFVWMPASGIPLSFGPRLFQWDDSYFKEGRGLAPDIYLTGENCEERLELFLDKYAEKEEEAADGQ